MSQASRTDAQAAIREVIERHYFRGMDELDFETFAPALHPEVRIAFVQEGELVSLDRETWRERLDAIRADSGHPLHKERSEKHLEAVQVVGKVASATVRFVFPSRTYTDFLTFAQGEGGWRIVSKTFHLELQS